MTQKREWRDVLDAAEKAAAHEIGEEVVQLLNYLEVRGLSEEQAVIVMQLAIRSLTRMPGDEDA